MIGKWHGEFPRESFETQRQKERESFETQRQKEIEQWLGVSLDIGAGDVGRAPP
jgi:hypothetical protein